MKQRRYTGWLFGAAAATLMSVLIATQNYFVLREVGQPRGWLELLTLELPVWLVWLAAAPLVFAVSRRFPLTEADRWRNLAVQLAAGAAVALLTLVAITIWKWPAISPRLPAGMTFVTVVLLEYRRMFAIQMMVYFGIVAVYHAAAYRRESERRMLRASQLETLLERAQRDLLRIQLHPHFLFNTLHAVSALMERDTPAARRMITRLSDLLRMALVDDARHEISLDEELEFLDKYLEIQRIRFRDRLSVRYEVEPDTRRLLVPRLLLQPLVENSITHGFSRMEAEGRVTIEARREDGRLTLRVRDNGLGLPAGGPEREGVGLSNTRARLEQLYGPAHAFEIGDGIEGGAEVRIDLPARSEEGTAPAELGRESARTRVVSS